MVSHPDLELYVTWAALEENLKGIRESLDSAMHSPKKDDSGKVVSHAPKESEQRFTQTVSFILDYLFLEHDLFFFQT